MPEQRKLPSGLMRDFGSDLFWGVALSQLMGDRETGEWILIFPFLAGEVIVTNADLGTGSFLSGN